MSWNIGSQAPFACFYFFLFFVKLLFSFFLCIGCNRTEHCLCHQQILHFYESSHIVISKEKPNFLNKTNKQTPKPSGRNRELCAGKGVKKREPSCTVDGNVNWYSHYGRKYGDSLKTGNKTTIWPSNTTYMHIPWRNQNCKRHTYSQYSLQDYLQ